MEKQMPVESEGLGPIWGNIGACIRGVTDQSASLVENFKPTLYELEVLAKHYLEKVREIEFDYRFLGESGSYALRMNHFARRRLATLESFLGAERFHKAIARTIEAEDRAFAQAEELEKNLEPCKACGAKRDYYDYAMSFIPDGICGACDHNNRQPATPSDAPDRQIQITLTEEQVAECDQRVEETRRLTEAHISRMSGGQID